MDDDSFEDSFESSSDSETQHDIVPAFTESNDFTRSQVPTSHTTNVPAGIKSIISLQSRFHSQSSPVELENNTIVQQQQLGLKLSLSPKFSPKNKKKFRPHFKKPQGLGNITQKMKKRKKKVFGVNLQTAVYRSQLGSDDIELPTVFRECIDYLEENGLEHQGLYRVGGVKSQIEGIKALYDKGVTVDLSEYDVNAVASLLKLYLRELQEPLIPQILIPQFDAAAKTDTAEIKLELLKQLMEEIPSCNKILLGWLLSHLSHISDKSIINKMSVSNLVIVFSPTLQIPVHIMHLLFNHRLNLFPNVEIKKYIRPQEQHSTPFDIPDPDSLETEEDITAELIRLNDLLEKLHTKVHATGRNYDERDDYCWELQRVVTELKRRKKVYEKVSASKLGDEQEFMKTLMIMDATLEAENEELKKRNTNLKESIREEAEKIENYKSQLRLYEGRERVPSPDNVDESEISKLLWQKRELQSQYNKLIDELESEEKAVLQLRVKLKVLPIEQTLYITE